MLLRQRWIHPYVIVDFPRAHGGHHSHADIGVEGDRIRAVGAGMSSHKIEVKGCEWYLITHDQDYANALGLRLHNALESQEGTTSAALLIEDAVSLIRKATERVVGGLRGVSAEGRFEGVERIKVLLRANVYECEDGGRVVQAEASPAHEHQGLTPVKRLIEERGREQDICVVCRPIGDDMAH